MAESRAKRMQVVLTLAEREEEQAGQQLSQCQAQVAAEVEQLRQLDEYAAQYLTVYGERKTGIRPHELIAYSGFIQRLGEAKKEQEGRLKRIQAQMDKLQQAWRVAHQKCKSIKELIDRLKLEESTLIDKRLQKEMDELVGQAYIRRENLE
jgi:flagellar protein FliJ